MDEKILNTIGKLTIEINGIKDALPKLEKLIKEAKPANDDNVLELMSKLEQRINANEKEISTIENRLFGLERTFVEIAKRINEHQKAFEDFKKKYEDSQELVANELARRAKISRSRSGKNLHVTDAIGLGGRVRAMRREKKLYVKDLVKATGIAENTITNIENYHAKFVPKETIKILSDFFGFDLFQFVEKGDE